MGINEINPQTANKANEVILKAPSLEVISCNVWPPCIAMNDGGATPTNVPNAKGYKGTPITGAVKLINQFGKNGVTRKNTM